MSNRVEKCRLCQGHRLEFILSLGEQSFTGVFPKPQDAPVPKGPLELVKCANCDLVQLAHSFDLNQLYGSNYGYRSGLNQSMSQHLRSKVDRIRSLYSLVPGDTIIDIGSNDSTLLRSYLPGDFQLIGVDPSGAKFRNYYPKEVKLVADFFSKKRLLQLLGDKKAKVITSIAMFYDLENPLEFVKEVRDLLTPDGVWVFEQSYLPLMLEQLAYDTICHEHLEYYALTQIYWMTERADLKIIDVEFNDVNGGSFSVTAARKDSPYPEATDTIKKILLREHQLGLSTLVPYQEFGRKVELHREELIQLITQLIKKGEKVLGYGASTKGNVILQYCGFTQKEIPRIAEVNEDKFGALTPGSLIPICSEKEAKQFEPNYFLVLPWHFRPGIIRRETAFLASGGKLIFPLPKLSIQTQYGEERPLEQYAPNTVKPLHP